jgi:phage-related protein
MTATPIARFTLHRILGRFAEVIYVLHAFQKKSTKGIQTSKTDVAMIKTRLRLAQQDYETRKQAND